MLYNKLERVEYPPKPLLQIRLFYCYAHGPEGKNTDSIMRDRIDRDTRQLQRQYGIVGWSDRQIPIGDDWEQRIFSEIDFADIILLLLSPDFISSDYCMEKELPRALHKQQQNSALVIPIILRPCAWKDEKRLSKLQALPGGGIPISDFDPLSGQEHAYLEIAQRIKNAVTEILTKKWHSSLSSGFTSIEAGHSVNARAIFDELIEFHEKFLNKDNEFLSFCSQAYCGRGIALRELKSYKDAFTAFQEALQHNPDYSDAYYQQGITLHDRNSTAFVHPDQLHKALLLFERTIALKPDFAIAHFEKGVLLDKLQKYSEARASFAQVLDCKPDFALAYYQLGMTHLAENQLLLAIEAFQKAVGLQFEYPPLYYRYSFALKKFGRLEEALSAIEYALYLNPSQTSYYHEKGETQVSLHKYADALVTYEQILNLDKTDEKAYCRKGLVLSQLERYSEAIIAYDEAISLNANFPDPYFGKRDVYSKLAEQTDAKGKSL